MGDIGVRYPQPGLIRVSVGGNDYMVDDEALAALKEQKVAFTQGERAPEQPGGYKESFGANSETMADTMRGAAHGATLGFVDKKFGDSNQSVAQRMGGDDYETVKERTPIGSAIGDLAGSMAIPVPGGAATAFGRIATQAAVGAGMGAARAYAEDHNAGVGALVGGGIGFGGSALSEGVAAGARKAAPAVISYLNSTADAARNRVAGLGGSDKQLAKIAERFGIDKLPERLAGALEALVPPSKGIGRGRSEYVEALDPIVEKAGAKIGELRENMGGMGPGQQGLNAFVKPEMQTLKDSLQAKLLAMPTRTATDRLEKNALAADIEAMADNADPTTFSGLADLKSHYQEAGHIGPMGSVPEQAAAESAAAIGRQSKESLENVMQYATDESRAAHQAASDEYGVAKMFRDQISPKALRDDVNTNLPKFGAAAIGTVLGGAGGAIAGGLGGAAVGHENLGAMGGAAAGAQLGLNMATGSGTRNMITQLLEQPKALDTIANITRASGKKLSELDLEKLRAFVTAYSGKLGGYVGGR